MLTPEGRTVLDKLRVSQGLDPELPWGGRSPRVLTRAHDLFSLTHEASSLDEFFDEDVIDEQHRRWYNGS
jgi:hypothetical protein